MYNKCWGLLQTTSSCFRHSSTINYYLVLHELIFSIWSRSMFLLHVIRVLRFAFKEANLKFAIFSCQWKKCKSHTQKKWFLQLLLKWNRRICFTYISHLFCDLDQSHLESIENGLVLSTFFFLTSFGCACMNVGEKSVCFLLSFFLYNLHTWAYNMVNNQMTERSL